MDLKAGVFVEEWTRWSDPNGFEEIVLPTVGGGDEAVIIGVLVAQGDGGYFLAFAA